MNFDDLKDETPAASGKPPKFDDLPEDKPSLAWSDVPGQAASNLRSSAKANFVDPFMHPVETAENIGGLLAGAGQKAGVLPRSSEAPRGGIVDKALGVVGSAVNPIGGAVSSLYDVGQKAGVLPQVPNFEHYADSLVDFYKQRYGNIEGLKQTLAHDPVGAAMDLSMFLTGGESAAARVPGLAVPAKIAGTVGRAMNPVDVARNVARGVGKGTAAYIGELGTGTGMRSIETAAQSGYEGGEAGKAFRQNLRDQAPMETTVDAAREGLSKMRDERSVAYKTGMAGVVSDPTVLDFDKIDQAYRNVINVKNFKGQNLSPETADIRMKLGMAIEDWRVLPPDEFHTAEGMDALKQKIGDIRDAAEYGTPARRVADEVYNGVKKTIVEQAPQYAKIMKGYEEASSEIKEIERTLSLNPNATIDTSLRKLQAILRDNVNTSYGRRGELAEYLTKAGAPNLIERLAGQSLKSPFARGLGRVVAQGIAHGATLAAGHAALGPMGLLTAPISLATMSPRLMGETAHLAGRLASPSKYVAPLVRPTIGAGRLQRGIPNVTVPRRAEFDQQEAAANHAAGGAVAFDPSSIGARKAKNHQWFIPDPNRPGKFLQVLPRKRAYAAHHGE